MNFHFTEEQLMFRQSLADLLRAKVNAGYLRDLSEEKSGRDMALWGQFVDMGLIGMCVSEDAGGLGLKPVDFVLLAEECGKHCLAEPLVDSTLVIAPVLEQLGAPAKDILATLISGKTRVAVGNFYDNLVDELHASEWLLAPAASGKELHILHAVDLSQQRQACVDQIRQLYAYESTSNSQDVTVKDAETIWRIAHNLGALGTAAQLLGLSQTMLNMSVAYCSDRKQFGKPIGSFQAVKHMLANVAIELECARPVIYCAAAALSANPLDKVAVAHAKLSAIRVSQLATKNCLQAHGAMGYTWEVDLHLWMKRAWSLEKSWGGTGVHKACVMDFLERAPNDQLGAGSGLRIDETVVN